MIARVDRRNLAGISVWPALVGAAAMVLSACSGGTDVGTSSGASPAVDACGGRCGDGRFGHRIVGGAAPPLVIDTIREVVDDVRDGEEGG